MNQGHPLLHEIFCTQKKHVLAPVCSGPVVRRRCIARSRYGLFPWQKDGRNSRTERFATVAARRAAGSGGFDEARCLSGQRIVAQCSSTHNTAEEMMQSANQILHQLEAAGAATQHASSHGSVVSGYASSTGSMSSTLNSSRDSKDSRDGGDVLSSLDEYSSSNLDFSDLANEDAIADASKGEGTAGGYGKANYEASGVESGGSAKIATKHRSLSTLCCEHLCITFIQYT